MGLQDLDINAGVDTVTGRLAWVSLHSADPGSTGASEIAGGSPAYARKASGGWDPAATRVSHIADAIDFDIPAATTVSHVGFWSAVTGGTWRGGKALSASEAFTGQGVYRLTDATLTGSSPS